MAANRTETMGKASQRGEEPQEEKKNIKIINISGENKKSMAYPNPGRKRINTG